MRLKHVLHSGAVGVTGTAGKLLDNLNIGGDLFQPVFKAKDPFPSGSHGFQVGHDQDFAFLAHLLHQVIRIHSAAARIIVKHLSVHFSLGLNIPVDHHDTSCSCLVDIRLNGIRIHGSDADGIHALADQVFHDGNVFLHVACGIHVNQLHAQLVCLCLGAVNDVHAKFLCQGVGDHGDGVIPVAARLVSLGDRLRHRVGSRLGRLALGLRLRLWGFRLLVVGAAAACQ